MERSTGDYRKGPRPAITGYEFHVITLATYVCPKRLLIDKLTETLEELRTREPLLLRHYDKIERDTHL